MTAATVIPRVAVVVVVVKGPACRLLAWDQATAGREVTAVAVAGALILLVAGAMVALEVAEARAAPRVASADSVQAGATEGSGAEAEHPRPDLWMADREKAARHT
jgi:hypothetical protein